MRELVIPADDPRRYTMFTDMADGGSLKATYRNDLHAGFQRVRYELHSAAQVEQWRQIAEESRQYMASLSESEKQRLVAWGEQIVREAGK